LPVSAIGSTSQISAPLLAVELTATRPDALAIEDNRASGTNGSKANYSMGLSMGVCIGVAGALGIPLIRLRPQEWKATVGIGTVKGTDTVRKEASRLRAIELWPHLAVTTLARKKDHNRADALLIGEAARRRMSQHVAT
jgi:hypothetical protein